MIMSQRRCAILVCKISPSGATKVDLLDLKCIFAIIAFIVPNSCTADYYVMHHNGKGGGKLQEGRSRHHPHRIRPSS